MSHIETMKQALEALEANDKLINGEGTCFGLEGAMDGYYAGCFDVKGVNKLTDQAITSLRQAIAEAEKQNLPDCKDGIKWSDYESDGRIIRTQSAQPKAEQEPNREPLTDEEIMEMYGEVGGATWISDFARAIEAAHGITSKENT